MKIKIVNVSFVMLKDDYFLRNEKRYNTSEQFH